MKLIENFDLSIRRVDEVLQRFDNVLKSFDSRLLSVPPPPPVERSEHARSEYVPSPSYPGQSPESYCLECLLAGTMVYGNDGLYAIEDLGSVEYGAKPKLLTHLGRGRSVTKFFSRHYDGDLVVINQYYTNIPLKLTPEHPILAVRNVRKPQTVWQDKGVDEERLEWVPAKDLTTEDFIAFPRIRETVDVEIVSGDLAELFGWYVAEGNYSPKDRGVNVEFSFGKHEGERISRVVSLIKKVFGVEPCVTEKKTAMTVVFSSKYWGPMFEQFGRNSHDKDLPTWFLHLPEEKQYRFLRGLIEGDGSITHPSKNGHEWTRIALGTVSKKLAYRLRLLLFRLGVLHTVHKSEEIHGMIDGREILGKEFYDVRISGAGALKLLEKIGLKDRITPYEYAGGRHRGYNYGWVGEKYVFLPILSITREPFSGTVYNVHVDEDESYLTIHGALHNCLSRHYLKAYGLLEEAERFSLGKGEITPEARQRVELALKEIVTAEEDLGTEIRDAELARMLDEIKVKQREFRKWVWAERLLTTQKDLSKLREAISKMKDIVEKTRRASEYYDEKYGRCSYCEMLAREISGKFGLNESEILDSIYGLASDNKERVSESAEKLKRLGVFEYTMQRVREMLTELKEREVNG